jgi:microcystin-dependent protein
MTDAYVGEIRAFGFNFAPQNWAICDGRLLSVAQYQALFSVLGTTYGGNGVSTFALPNLQATTPLGMGQGPGLSNYVEGEMVGSAGVTLLVSEMPAHTHTLNAGALSPANSAQNVATPTANTAFFGLSGANDAYSDVTTPNTSFHPQEITATGGSQPHDNRQPYLAINFCICLNGNYPPHG